MKKILLYINFILMFFPAFSLSYPLTGVYFQSRILGLPFLCWYTFFNKREIRKDLLIFGIPLLISVVIPILGLLTDRNFSLIDIGYMLTFLYLIIFAQAMGRHLNLFINFINVFTFANILYCLIQTIMMNVGLDSIAMIHSNLPLKATSGYVLPPSILPYTYRFSGLFNESSPLMFYLCCAYIFLGEIDAKKNSKITRNIQVLTLLTILVSGSKYSYAFLIIYAVIQVVSTIKDKNIKISLSTILLMMTTYLFINYYSMIVTSLSESLPAFDERKSNLENSVISLSNLDLIGNGFLPSSTGESGGLDAITIVVGGYGFFFGIAILISFLVWILVSKVKNKAIFIAVYILGLSSNGSFLISQYTIFFTMIYVINKQQSIQKYLFNDNEYMPPIGFEQKS